MLLSQTSFPSLFPLLSANRSEDESGPVSDLAKVDHGDLGAFFGETDGAGAAHARAGGGGDADLVLEPHGVPPGLGRPLQGEPAGCYLVQHPRSLVEYRLTVTGGRDASSNMARRPRGVAR